MLSSLQGLSDIHVNSAALWPRGTARLYFTSLKYDGQSKGWRTEKRYVRKNLTRDQLDELEDLREQVDKAEAGSKDQRQKFWIEQENQK